MCQLQTNTEIGPESTRLPGSVFIFADTYRLGHAENYLCLSYKTTFLGSKNPIFTFLYFENNISAPKIQRVHS